MAAATLGLGAGGCKGGGEGGAGVFCLSDKDCTPRGQLCDMTRRVCVSCLDSLACGTGADCLNGSCVPFMPCENSLDCPAGNVCDRDRGRCLACLTTADCPSGQVCAASVCWLACASDLTCTSQRQICDLAAGHCADCVTTADCGAGRHCVSWKCEANTCEPLSARCDRGAVLTCNDQGTGFVAPTTCAGNACRQGPGDAGARCADGGI